MKLQINFQSCKDFPYDLPALHDSSTLPMQNVAVTMVKWFNKINHHLFIETYFCCCLAVVINFFLMWNLPNCHNHGHQTRRRRKPQEIWNSQNWWPTNWWHMNQLTHELGGLLATVPTSNGSRDEENFAWSLSRWYIAFSTDSKPFVVPQTPGPFLATVNTNEVDCLEQFQNWNTSSPNMRHTKAVSRQHNPRSSRPLTQNGLWAHAANY